MVFAEWMLLPLLLSLPGCFGGQQGQAPFQIGKFLSVACSGGVLRWGTDPPKTWNRRPVNEICRAGRVLSLTQYNIEHRHKKKAYNVYALKKLFFLETLACVQQPCFKTDPRLLSRQLMWRRSRTMLTWRHMLQLPVSWRTMPRGTFPSLQWIQRTMISISLTKVGSKTFHWLYVQISFPIGWGLALHSLCTILLASLSIGFTCPTVRELYCEGLVSLLTTDARCSSPWLEAARFSAVPTFHLLTGISCVHQQHDNYPPRQTLDGVFRHLLDTLEWTAINIFYEETFGTDNIQYTNYFCLVFCSHATL